MVEVAVVAAVILDEPSEGLYLPVLHEGELGRVYDVVRHRLKLYGVESVLSDDGCEVLSESRLAVGLALVGRDGEDTVVHEPSTRSRIVKRMAVGDAHLAVGRPAKVDDAVFTLRHSLKAGVEVLEVEALVVVALADESAAIVVALKSCL